jgi:histidinol-phosphate aminotransferase
MSLEQILDEIVAGHIKSLPIYQPGKPVSELEREIGITGAIKLASNENPLGTSPRAMAAASAAISGIHEYPDGGAFALRRGLAARLGVGESELILGAGCNEIIHMVAHALCGPGDEVVSHRYAFISYKLAALSQGATFVEAEVTDQLGCDVEALLAKVTDRTRVVFVANPNNPTGAHLGAAGVEALIDRLPERVLLVIDEAYYEYATAAGADYGVSLELRDRRPMLLTLRTFSKIYGLAGLRVGYGVARPELAQIIERLRRPFNVNSVAQAAALAALDDAEHAVASAALARDGIASLRAAAESLGIRAYPSLGNFVLVDVDRDAAGVYQRMLAAGVIVRPLGVWGLPTCLRISVGTAEQVARATAALSAVLT